MFSLVGVGKKWAGPVFLHAEIHLHKVDAFTFQGGERTGRPNFSPNQKLTTKHHFCFCLSGKTMGWPSFSTKQILTITYYEKIKEGGELSGWEKN